jgi:hypothetical protein
VQHNRIDITINKQTMYSSNPDETLAKAIYTALPNPEILPDIERNYRNQQGKVRPSVTDVEIYHFPQMWGSTALGFGGFGGAAMTTAYTTVIVCEKNAAVFFEGRHAYSVDDFGPVFLADIGRCKMASIDKAVKYNEVEKAQ